MHIKRKSRSNEKKATKETTIAKAAMTTTMAMAMRNCNSHKRKRHVTIVVRQDTWHHIVQREKLNLGMNGTCTKE